MRDYSDTIAQFKLWKECINTTDVLQTHVASQPYFWYVPYSTVVLRLIWAHHNYGYGYRHTKLTFYCIRIPYM